MDAKRLAAEAAVERIEDGMVVGLGTGTTAYWAIQRIGARVKAGLRIKAIATSKSSEAEATRLAIPLTTFREATRIDIAIDGADEVDPDCNLIKGGGGALLREKIVAAASREFIVIVDESKIVRRLGTFPLPVEVVPFGAEMTKRRIEALGCTSDVREKDGRAFVTDNGNLILDCKFGPIANAKELHEAINGITGVVDNGLFIGMAKAVMVGFSDGNVKTYEPKR